MRIARSLLGCIVGLALFPASVRADGIDLVSYFSRVGYHSSVPAVVVLVIVFMAINYGLNFIFIGLPAMCFGKISRPVMARDLVLLTIAGQMADRLGALVAAFTAEPIAEALHLQGEAAWAGPLVFLNLGLSAVAIAFVVLFFCRRRWHLAFKWTALVMLLAVVFTNPVYGFFLGWILP
jgi:hypothetical protein